MATRYLTVVFAIEDEEGFKPLQDKFHKMMLAHKTAPWRTSAMSLGDEMTRGELVETAINEITDIYELQEVCGNIFSTPLAMCEKWNKERMRLEKLDDAIEELSAHMGTDAVKGETEKMGIPFMIGKFHFDTPMVCGVRCGWEGFKSECKVIDEESPNSFDPACPKCNAACEPKA